MFFFFFRGGGRKGQRVVGGGALWAILGSHPVPTSCFKMAPSLPPSLPPHPYIKVVVLYNQNYEVDRVSPMSLKRCVLVSLVMLV